MFDQYKREINYLRISVTDRCNLRCKYCMPAEGVVPMRHEDILRFDEIIDFTRVAVEMGIDKVRITGGEPLVRKGIVDLIEMLAQIKGINDLGMTTNAIFLDKYAKDLAQAGLNRVNVSLDTLDPEKFKDLTRGGDIERVLRGIKAAEEAGLTPIKLNCVINHSSDEPDARMVKNYADENGYQVRFIHLMDLKTGHFKPVEGGEGGNCAVCNRLRLTSDGQVMPCLFSKKGYPIRDLGAKEALNLALENKPKCGGVNPSGEFYNIGG
jgi:cyclic pyranopterin phosphate synthase